MAAVANDVLTKLHPSLLARARELAGNDGEDLLQDAYLRFCERPPRSRKELKIKHWFRTVLLNMHIDRYNDRKFAAPTPPDA